MGNCLQALLLYFSSPELAKHTVYALEKPYSGAYIVTLCESAMLLFTITIIQFPRIKKIHNTNSSNPSLTITGDGSNISSRSLFVIASQRAFLIAVFIGFVSWSAMAIQMSGTPLAMKNVGYDFIQVTTAVECHLLGMFAPSFFSGTLCHWFGSRLVMIAGLFIQLIGIFIFQRGFEISYFYLGLILVGIGWNFGYVGASTLLTKSYRREEKTKTHSLFEGIVMLSISIAFFSSAFAVQFLGWKILTERLISTYVATTLLILTLDTTFVIYKTKNIRAEIIVDENSGIQ